MDDTKYYVLEFGLNASQNSESYTGYYTTMEIWISEIDGSSIDGDVLFNRTVRMGESHSLEIPEGATYHISVGTIYDASGNSVKGALGVDHFTMTGNYSYYIDLNHWVR